MEAPAPRWDPAQYARFADDRGRPFFDLLARVSHRSPTRVVDLGCGPGDLTATLLERWPRARIEGVDSSPEMVAEFRRRIADVAWARTPSAPGPSSARRTGLSVHQADLREWVTSAARASYDVVVSNAALQWVPGHLALLPQLVALLAPGGYLAIQIPGNLEAPSHTLLRELATSKPFADHVGHLAERPALPGPADYLSALSAQGLVVDAWETTYLHVLQGPDPVWEWIRGTGARPVLQGLPDGLREEFADVYRARLREAYPAQKHGTVLPFRRVFAVGAALAET